MLIELYLEQALKRLEQCQNESGANFIYVKTIHF
jgi:hypothetical protein